MKSFLLCRSAIAKMSAAAIILTLAVAIAGAAYYLTLPAPSPSPSLTPTPSPSPSPTKTYLTFRNGTETRVLLLDSDVRYGTYDRDVVWPPQPEYSAKKGDPCVIIYGTIRNDYDKDYYICLVAEIYNATGEKVGTVVSPYSTKPWFETVYVKSNDVSSFEIHIKYDKKDIIDYDVFVAWEPTEIPPL